MKTYIVNRSKRRMPKRFLEDWVRLLAREIRDDVDETAWIKKEIGLVFLDVTQARALNKTYRGKDYATDVLSFEGDAEETLGELVICPDVIERQAEEHGLKFREELGYMVIHGLLHLLGFEHERGGAAAKRMYAIQDRVFERLCRRFEAAKPKSQVERRKRRRYGDRN